MTPTPCSFPTVTFVWCDKRITVHAGIVAPLKRIEAKWRARGGHSAYRIGPNTWGYACRKTRSGSRWSDHARGWALDINSESNPYGKNLVTNMPAWFVQLFKDEGFGWGGDWQSVKDAMHFSKNPAEGGDGRLEPLPQEDDLPYTEVQLRKIMSEEAEAAVLRVLNTPPTDKKFEWTGWAKLVWKALWKGKPDGTYEEHLNVIEEKLP